METTYSSFWPRGGSAGRLHHYSETLVAFEFTSDDVAKPHSLIFVGGLGDGIATTSYLADLAQALRPTPWSLFTINLTSSYSSWGLGHLDRDTDEIAQCLNYIRDYKNGLIPGGKITLMGHSTGSQDVLHYLYRPNPHASKHSFDASLEHVKRLVLDGAIMQAPVSDREVIKLVLSTGWNGKSPAEVQAVYDELVVMAQEAESLPFDTLLPLVMTSMIAYPANTPVSARRFLSLNSPESPDAPREDDLFSSDLDASQLAKTFGKIETNSLLKGKLLVLYSGADQSVPDWVDKKELMSRWRAATDASGTEIWDNKHSGIIANASHALSKDDQAPCRAELVQRVLGYLETVERN
ncbi:Fusarinine C esterase-like protein [Elsinoe fawcettii]|nr:Fusarinine C esterase-like protein [Elsinoe fawcettii]